MERRNRDTGVVEAVLFISVEGDDPAATDYFVFLIENGGLAGGNGALRFVEDGVDGVFVYTAEGCR